MGVLRAPGAPHRGDTFSGFAIAAFLLSQKTRDNIEKAGKIYVCRKIYFTLFS